MRLSGLCEKFQAEGDPNELARTRSPATTPESNGCLPRPTEPVYCRPGIFSSAQGSRLNDVIPDTTQFAVTRQEQSELAPDRASLVNG